MPTPQAFKSDVAEIGLDNGPNLSPQHQHAFSREHFRRRVCSRGYFFHLGSCGRLSVVHARRRRLGAAHSVQTQTSRRRQRHRLPLLPYPVESSEFAGLPPTQTCMNCHSQLFATSPVLSWCAPVFRPGCRFQRNRVDALPDFVSFDHSTHIQKGAAAAPPWLDAVASDLLWFGILIMGTMDDMVTRGWLNDPGKYEMRLGKTSLHTGC